MRPDIIGTIYQPTGVMLTDSDGNEYPEMEAIPGYHVNTPEPVPEWDAYRIYPVTPSRVYAGKEPVCYSFATATEYEDAYTAVFGSQEESV